MDNRIENASLQRTKVQLCLVEHKKQSSAKSHLPGERCVESTSIGKLDVSEISFIG